MRAWNRCRGTISGCQKTYTREQIHAALGGDMWSYLPVSGGRVVAGCFRTDLNPGAPEVVLPGTGDQIEASAEILAAQAEPIPVFLKDGPNRWRYVGDYRCVGLSRDKAEIDALAKKAGRDDVTCVLRLEAARRP
jgi:hypothetical protein